MRNFNRHSELEGRHALLSPSTYAWLRYDDDKIERMYLKHLAHLRGTREHAYAAEAIELRHKQSDEPTTINMYINDCIGWRMRAEVALYWSDFCFGRVDAIGYDEHRNILRISDLKTGGTPTKFDQLLVYAALFCLEYEIQRPWELEAVELRIYQNNGVKFWEASEDVFPAMDRIITASRLLDQVRDEQFI